MTNEETMRGLLRDQRADLVLDMATANRPIEKRLDELTAQVREQNGRVRKGELAEVEHDGKIRNLEREVFARRSSDKDAAGDAGENRRITMRDVRLVLAGGGAMLIVVGFLMKVLPLMLKAGQP